ncbi:HesA/MoeB/ThiF family protein [Agromyces sp. SYSU T0242]|uniref:HesA/MoeB/ThiF family protein n=1 Tax=Agromyces litoreus TaxID=3158561 RepID=UPI00339A3AD5
MPVDPASVRFARQRVLPGLGASGQRRLAEAHVVVLGAGGLGSAVIPGLAAAGVGRLTLVDHDLVEPTNLHRQTLHHDADVGRPKVESAAETARQLAPGIDVRPVAARFDERSADGLLADADLVVDGTDDLGTRYVADAAAARAGVPLVWGSAARFSGQAGVCWEARGVSYRDLFPEPPADAGLSCEIDGILPTVCTVTGGLMAGEVLKLLAGIGEPLLGRVAVYDALTGRTREIAYARADEPEPADLVAAPGRGVATQPPPAPARSGAEERALPGEVDARTLAAELASPSPPLLLDVREPWEAEVASIRGAILIPLGDLAARTGELDPEAPVVVFCHLGVRSRHAAERMASAGFASVRNLTGGIDAWSVDVDAAVTRY